MSVVILNHNGRDHLESCFSSLLRTSYPLDRIQILLLDNGSSDDSVEFVRTTFPQVEVISSQENMGFGRGVNLASRDATGEYLALLNNDMRFDPELLDALVDTIDSQSGVVCTGAVVLNWEGTHVDFCGRPDDALAFSLDSDVRRPDQATKTLFVSGGALLIKKQVFDELGGFDPDYFLYHEDVDLCWRLWLRGYRCVLSPRAVVYHKGGGTSGRLDQSFVQRMSHYHGLSTIFKVLEAANLGSILPFMLYFLVERSLAYRPARHAVATGLGDFLEALPSLVERRRAVQSTRQRSDLEVFSEAGYPLGFLVSRSWPEQVRLALERTVPAVDFDSGTVCEIRRALIVLITEIETTFVEHLASDLKTTQDRCGGFVSINEALEAEVTKRGVEIERQGVEIARLRTEIGRRDSEVQRINLEMAALTEAVKEISVELDRIKSTRGWRLLNRYGRIKYRYLLPMLRGLGLSGPDRDDASLSIQSVIAASTNQNGDQTQETDPESVRLPGEDTSDSEIAPLTWRYSDRFAGFRSYTGRCNICGCETGFFYNDEGMYRESLTCAQCLTTSRYRSIARGILRAIHELTQVTVESLSDLRNVTSERIVRVYDTQVPFYGYANAYPIPDVLSKCSWIRVHTSKFESGKAPGESLGFSATNQNLEGLTFEDASFDVVITSDVMEHVRLDDLAHREIRRILRPRGVYLFTVPHFRNHRNTLVRVAPVDPLDPSKDLYLLPREFHGDANSETGKALSYRSYGTELDSFLETLGFEVDYSIKDHPETGILSTELYYCRVL